MENGHDEAMPGLRAAPGNRPVEAPAMQQASSEHRRPGNDQKLALRMRRMRRRVQPTAGETAEDDDRHVPTGQQSRRMTPAGRRFRRGHLSPSRQTIGVQHLP